MGGGTTTTGHKKTHQPKPVGDLVDGEKGDCSPLPLADDCISGEQRRYKQERYDFT
jgi:hypothetical protein